MTGLIIALASLGIAYTLTTTIFAVKLRKQDENLTALAQCMLTYMVNPESVDIVEDYNVKSGNSDFDFPNSTGF